MLAVGGVSVGSVWNTFPGLPDAPASAKHLLYYYLSGRPEDEWDDLDEGKAHIRFQYHTATESDPWDFTFSEELKKAAIASESSLLTQTVKAFDKTKADLAGLRQQLEQHKANIDKCINAQKAWDACNLFLQTDDVDTVAKAASATADKFSKLRTDVKNKTKHSNCSHFLMQRSNGCMTCCTTTKYTQSCPQNLPITLVQLPSSYMSVKLHATCAR